MKKVLFLAMAVIMVVPMLFSCQSNEPESTKYGTADTAITVTLTIVNPNYVPPTSEPMEGEEVEVDVNNPEYFYNGTLELYVTEGTVEDALKAAFVMIKENYPSSIEYDENDVAVVDINGLVDSISAGASAAWEYKINNNPATKAIGYEPIKNGDKIVAEYVTFGGAATTETQESTVETSN